MLRRSWTLLSGLAGCGGFAAFQLKVEEGQSKPLLPSQQQKLKAFYHASQAVAHLPSVVDIARALVYKQYEANKGIVTPSPRNNNHHNRTRSRSRSPNGRSARSSSSKTSTSRGLSTSNNTSSRRSSSDTHRRDDSTKKNKSGHQVGASVAPNSRLPSHPTKRKSLSVKEDPRPAKMLRKSRSPSSLSSTVTDSPAAIPSTSHSLGNKATGSGDISAKTLMKTAAASPATRKSLASSSLAPKKGHSSSPHGSKTKRMKRKKHHRPSRPKVAAKKEKTLTLKEKLARRRYNGFRRTVLRVSGLKEGKKIDLRIQQLWHLLLKKRVKPEKRVTVAIRVLRPKALQAMKRLKSTQRAGATPLSSLKKINQGGELVLSTSRRSAGLKASPPLLSGMSKKKIGKQNYIKFRDTVMAKTGGSPSDAEHRRRIHELWKILLSKSITLQERIAIAVRVLGSKDKKTSFTTNKSEKRRDVKGSVHHPPSAPHRLPTSFRSSTSTSRALSLDRDDSTSAKKNYLGTFSSSLMSKRKKDQGTFLAFRTAVMSSVKMTPQQRVNVEKALRGLWSIPLKKRMSFDQRVSVARKMLIESLRQLERSAAQSRRTPLQKQKKGGERMGGTRGQMKGNKSNKKKSYGKSSFMGLHSSPSYDGSLTPMEGALPRPPGGVTIATSSGVVEGVAGHGSAGHATSAVGGAGKHNFGRRPLSKKQLDFLAFYRAMLMTGHISRDPTERSKTIKYLWGNTRHLKSLEARIKLSEAHLAGAIRFPLVSNEASRSSSASGTMTAELASPSTSSSNNNNNNVGSVGSVGTGSIAWNSSKPLKTS